MSLIRRARAGLVVVAAFSFFQLGSQSLQPSVSISSIPPWGSDGNITGEIYGNTSQGLSLYIFAFVPDLGWTGIPGSCAPVFLQGSQFSVSATPTVILRMATRFNAYLVPSGLQPNCPSPNSTTVPFIFQHNAIAMVTYARVPQYSTLTFGGLEWYIKDAPIQVSPGPQFFVKDNAYVDTSGQLHLRITPCGSSWCAAEVFTKQTVGYGTYRFTINSQVGNLDPNLTLGLFSWDAQAGDQYNREWDIEFGRWGNPGNPANAQFVVQPYNGPNNIQRFTMSAVTPSTHLVSWTPAQVNFSSSTANGSTISQWNFNGAFTPVPTPGDVHLHLNFYVASGPAPSVPAAQEIVIGAFQYTPAAAQVGFSRIADTVSFESNSFAVPLTSTAPNCSASIDSDSPWLTVSGSNVIPAGGAVQYTVPSNWGGPRSGRLLLTSTSCNAALGAQVLTVNQGGLICSPVFSLPSTHIGYLQSMLSIGIRGTAPPCTWSVGTSASWLHIVSGASGAGDGTVQVAVDPNADSDLRQAVLSLNGPLHLIYQDGSASLLALSPQKAYGCGGYTARFGLSWFAPASVEFHLNSPTGQFLGQFASSGTTLLPPLPDGSVIYMVQAPAGGAPHTLASARTVVVGSDCGSAISPLGIVNAASYSAASLAPGGLATVFGSNLSPGTAQASGGAYPTTLGGASVLLAGQACPLWYASPGQINFAVPANVAPGRYIIAVGAATSDVLITSTSPGIFTLKGDGTGVPMATVSAVLSDGSVVPLPPYQCDKAGCSIAPMVLPDTAADLYVVLYGTGIRNYRNISATLGNSIAEVLYVGAHPQFPGLDQVNLHWKAPFALAGTQSLQLQVDGRNSNSVTLQFQ